MRSGVCPKVDLAQRQNSKASRSALGVCSGLLSCSGVRSGPSRDILTEVVWSLPPGDVLMEVCQPVMPFLKEQSLPKR